MPTLVHLADQRNAESNRKNGIKPIIKGLGIYAMPVMQNFYLSHQWLRELKSNGAKTIVGVYFKMDSAEMVYVGRYNKRHQLVNLGTAIKMIMEAEDALGYEIIINRKIGPKEISKIKHLPQVIGWRYFPESNNVRPCYCEFCLKGTIKGRKTLNRQTVED